MVGYLTWKNHFTYDHTSKRARKSNGGMRATYSGTIDRIPVKDKLKIGEKSKNVIGKRDT